MYVAEVVTVCENLEVKCIIFCLLIIKACHIVVENKMPGINGITHFKRGKKLEETGKRSSIVLLSVGEPHHL